MEEDLFDIDIVGAGDLDFISTSQFDHIELEFTEPDNSFWTDRKRGQNKQLVIRARIINVDKATGTMQVVGIDSDINIEIPITSSFAGSEYYGDVSLPARGWEVILLQVENGEYYPIVYKRPYSEKNGWSTNVPDEIEPGDFGIATKGGGKLFLLDSGLLQMESSPSCMRVMSPIEDDERIEDLCRKYGMHTEAGNIKFSEYENSPIGASRYALTAGMTVSSKTKEVGSVKVGAFDETGTSGGFMARSVNQVSGKTSAKILIDDKGVGEISSDLSFDISSKRVTLGGSNAVEPIPLGSTLLTRVVSIEAKLNEIITAAQTHVHPTTSGPTLTSLVFPSTYAPGKDFLSTVSFSK